MIADHFITFVLVLILPIYSFWSWRRFQRAIAEGRESARLRAYAETIAMEWGLAVVVLVGFLAAGRGAADLGLAVPLTGVFGITSLLVVIASLLLLGQIRTTRGLDEAAGASLRQQMASVESLIPHTDGELSVFLAVSVTAGFCEELLYRGFLIGYFAPMTGPAVAVAISAVVFGLAHAYQGGTGIVKTGMVGAVMGVIFIVSGSIWPAIILHVILDVQGGLIGHELFGRKVTSSSL